MTRTSKLLCSSGVVFLLAILVLGWIAYGEFYGQGKQFDDSFYAARTRPAEFDYAPYGEVLRVHVNAEGLVDYAAMKAEREPLDEFARMLAAVKPDAFEKWDRPAKIVFWINAYNALTLKVIIDHYPIEAGLLRGQFYPKNSIRQIPGVWDQLQFLVLGKRMTLGEIEHEVLRKEFDEPRIHVALVCAAMSCPPLRTEPYVGDRLDEQLDDQSRRFLRSGSGLRIDREAGRVRLSSIFEWFGRDFVASYAPPEDPGDPEAAVLDFAARYLPEKEAEYIRTGDYSVSYLDYDWSLNEQPRKAPSNPEDSEDAK